jgi:hypothetical protein
MTRSHIYSAPTGLRPFTPQQIDEFSEKSQKQANELRAQKAKVKRAAQKFCAAL